MKKLFLSLMLIFALLTTSAVAEPEYAPGEIANALVEAAFEAGQIIGESVGMNLSLNMEAIGLDEETAAQAQLMLDFISALRVTGAAGVTSNGLSLLGEISYAPADSRDFASADAAVTINLDGISMDSSLLPGKRIVVGYDEILSAAGVPDDMIVTILSAIHGDEEAIDACIAMLIDELYASLGLSQDFDWEAAFEQAANIAMPYVSAIGDWASSLDLSVEQNAQVEGYPDVDSRVVLTITAADLANLIDALANQIQADETLAPMLNSLIASGLDPEEGDEPVTIVEVCEDAKEIAAELREEEIAGIGLIASIGMAEDAGYFDLFDNTGLFNLHFVLAPTEDENTFEFGFSFAFADEFSLAFGGTFFVNPEDENHIALNMDYIVNVSDEPALTMTYTASTEPCVTEDGMPAYSLAMNENVQVIMTDYDEEGNAQTETSAIDVQLTGLMHETEKGEAVYMDIIMNNDELGMPISISEYGVVEAESGYLSGGEAFGIAIPDLFELVIHSSLFSFEYDNEIYKALEPIHVLTLSEEEMGEIANTVMTNAQAQLEKAISLMPEGLPELISELMD